MIGSSQTIFHLDLKGGNGLNPHCINDYQF